MQNKVLKALTSKSFLNLPRLIWWKVVVETSTTAMPKFAATPSKGSGPQDCQIMDHFSGGLQDGASIDDQRFWKLTNLSISPDTTARHVGMEGAAAATIRPACSPRQSAAESQLALQLAQVLHQCMKSRLTPEEGAVREKDPDTPPNHGPFVAECLQHEIAHRHGTAIDVNIHVAAVGQLAARQPVQAPGGGGDPVHPLPPLGHGGVGHHEASKHRPAGRHNKRKSSSVGGTAPAGLLKQAPATQKRPRTRSG